MIDVEEGEIDSPAHWTLDVLGLQLRKSQKRSPENENDSNLICVGNTYS